MAYTTFVDMNLCSLGYATNILEKGSPCNIQVRIFHIFQLIFDGFEQRSGFSDLS
jgi:hypothetical protein